MGNSKDGCTKFNAIIREQRKTKPDAEVILNTVKELPNEHLVEYLGFLEHEYGIKAERNVSKVIFAKLEITDAEFIETYSAILNSQTLERLAGLVLAKSDRLLDTYLNTPFPEKMINEYALIKANQINVKYKGKFRNALELIKLGIELNKGSGTEELFATFKMMKEKYSETNFPPVDINTFFKLSIPILKRCSLKSGAGEFFELRDRIIEELKKDGLTPDQVSISILDRRGKHRSGQLTSDDYKGFDLY